MKYCGKCGRELIPAVIDERRRLRCPDEACGYVFWNNPTPVVAMLVETEEGIVLAHNKAFPPGMFSFITGFLEAGEAPEEAAVRETREELSLEADRTEFVGAFPFRRMNQLVLVYHVFASGAIRLNEELDDYRIVQRTDLLGYAESGRFEVAIWFERMRVLRPEVTLSPESGQ
jgi:NAD+ diphosphatase